MILEINGIFSKALPTVDGESASGKYWIRGGFVLTTEEEKPSDIAFGAFGEERVNAIKAVAVGTPVTVRFAIDSREFNEKWYTNLNCISVKPREAQQPQEAEKPKRGRKKADFPADFSGDNTPTPSMPAEKENDLPF